MGRLLILAGAGVTLIACSSINATRFEARPVAPDGYRSGDLAADPYQLGKRQLAAGHVGLAIDAFRKALRANPTSVDALNGLAVAYDRIARFDLSRRYYEQALGIEPHSAFLLHNYGYSLALQGRAEEARQLMAKAASAGDPAVSAKAQQSLARLNGAPSVGAERPFEQTVTWAHQWIERTSASVQTLVTAGNAAPGPIEPRLRMLNAAEAPVGRIKAGHGLQSTAEAVAAMADMTNESVTVAPAESGPLQVVNGVGRSRMATRMKGYLSRRGVKVAGLHNGTQTASLSEIHYNAANGEAALAVARLLPFEVALRPRAGSPPDVVLILGRNALGFDDKLQRQNREV